MPFVYLRFFSFQSSLIYFQLFPYVARSFNLQVVVLLVHSLDGSPLLRTRTHQSALAVLAASPRIRLIASVDHVNAGLLWDADLAASFR